MSRPYLNLLVDELRSKAEKNQDNLSELQLIAAELQYRSTWAAGKLREQVEIEIRALKQSSAKSPPTISVPEATTSNKSSDLPAPQEQKWTYQAVAKLRAKLIDLSRKSPLIAFKHASRSTSQLRFIDERPDLLFAKLADGTMGFEPLPGEEQTPADERTPQFGIAYEHARLTDTEFLIATEKLGETENDARAWQDAERSLRSRVRMHLGLPKIDYGKAIDVGALARAHGFDPSYDLKLSNDGEIAEHHEDDSIRVLLVRKELDRRLKSIADRATSHLRETGHHTLHLAFGFVQWFEDDASDIANQAPLLLLPVSLQKDESRVKKDYRLGAWEGALEVNVALVEKAREHWGLSLPELLNEETPEAYFIRVRAVLEQGRRLTLRTFATLSVLPPMILWRDLDPARWPENAFVKHRLLSGLVGATEIPDVIGNDTFIDIDDPVNNARVPALITDADASQHRAIMDMAAGRDMAIEGPPGTGKSQTITNMIATALALGKRVLFVAEKQAALRVVSDRLRALGFGPLLLELHGDKASRTEVYSSIRERFEGKFELAQPAGWWHPQALENKRAELCRNRDLLRRYLALVRTPLGKLEATAYELAWREICLRNTFDIEQIKAMAARWSPQNPSELNRQALTLNRETLAQFGKALLGIQQANGGLGTRWALAGQLDPFNQSNALDAAAEMAHAAHKVAQAAERLHALGIILPSPGNEDQGFFEQLSTVSQLSCSDEKIVRTAIHYRSESMTILQSQSDWLDQLKCVANEIETPETVSSGAANEFREALQIDQRPETLIKAKQALEINQKILLTITDASRDIERLSARLSSGVQLTVSNVQQVALEVASLGGVDPNVDALLSRALIDAVSGSAIALATKEVSELLAEQDLLLSFAQTDALDADPAELEEMADTLESTGSLSRLFSGRFKAARRRTTRLFSDGFEREKSAANLRRTAAYIRARHKFRDESKVKNLYPSMLWDGVRSNFESLRFAQSLVSKVALRLSKLDEMPVLAWWLSADTAERQVFSALCSRVSELLIPVMEGGYSTVMLSDLPAACKARISALQRLISASEAVRIREGAAYEIANGLTVADGLLTLNAARDAFEAQRRLPHFDWVLGIETPLEALRASLNEVEALISASGPVDLKGLLGASETPSLLISSLANAMLDVSRVMANWKSASNSLWEIAKLNFISVCKNLSWPQAAETFDAMVTDRHGVGLAADLLKYRFNVSNCGLSEFSEAASSGVAPPDRLDDLYELLATSALLTSYLTGDGQELGRLGSLSLEAARQSYKRVDRELHKLEAAAIVRSRLADQAPAGIGHGPRSTHSELALLKHEVELKRPRTPLREVGYRAGNALQALKPVWMMSPTSIAQFIRPGSLNFDLLIIDEASQMRPEFSISCIMRADQFVVVGDANQLPPSDHFQVANLEPNDDDEEGVGVDENTESILDLANQRFKTKPRLKWHYRSQHESLIQFSNREFYDRDLIVFPSPMANDDPLLGVKCFYAPTYFPDTVYEASINQREAELVIEQAFGLMQTHPERSIGIVAMNSKQTELIQNEFDRLVVEEERVRRYVEAFKDTIDEFFIKNLENVQGDERDIILISTVYGPDKNGNVRQNFGLMNREVGWRRLNVLVTRAKLSCRLITSLRPDDVKVTDQSSRGVIAFKSYLTYAHGGAEYRDASGGETDSDFEIFVADALRSAGYEVIYQVGVENFRIDLGVRHKSCPVGFIAGIECDGAPYHSGLSVRDRDHIRQSILENLGWKIYRVWSTDWFADQARETAKLISWLDGVRDKVVQGLGAPGQAISPRKPVPKDTLELPTASASPEATAVVPDLDGSDLTDQNDHHSARQPQGRELRKLGDFQTYEAISGKLYEIWRGERFLGEVEVLKRATTAPRLYGAHAQTEQSEYEGRVELTGENFRSFDVYAAIREVASKAVRILEQAERS